MKSRQGQRADHQGLSTGLSGEYTYLGAWMGGSSTTGVVANRIYFLNLTGVKVAHPVEQEAFRLEWLASTLNKAGYFCERGR